MPFTAAELEAMKIADAEIDRDFKEYQKAYYEANKEAIAARQKAYREAKK